jgi:uncharacterized membrane protein YadS
MKSVRIGRIVFIFAAYIALSGLPSPPIALAVGMAFGLLFVHPLGSAVHRWSVLVLQFSVVALGFGMNVTEVVLAGRAALSIRPSALP